ncbi:hypothetical protein HK104_002120 [Borealophlyctis nickersoniae]|nr:hypothetical protein HK104_002120 [Borealophlyctis nickersoniae]
MAAFSSLPLELIVPILSYLPFAPLSRSRRVSRAFLQSFPYCVLRSLLLTPDENSAVIEGYSHSFLSPPLLPASYDVTTNVLTLVPHAQVLSFIGTTGDVGIPGTTVASTKGVLQLKIAWKGWPKEPEAELFSDFHKGYREERSKVACLDLLDEGGERWVADTDWIAKCNVQPAGAESDELVVVNVVHVKVLLDWVLKGLRQEPIPSTPHPTKPQIYPSRYETARAAGLHHDPPIHLTSFDPLMAEYLDKPRSDPVALITAAVAREKTSSLLAAEMYRKRRAQLEQCLEETNIDVGLLWKYGFAKRWVLEGFYSGSFPAGEAAKQIAERIRNSENAPPEGPGRQSLFESAGARWLWGLFGTR